MAGQPKQRSSVCSAGAKQQRSFVYGKATASAAWAGVDFLRADYAVAANPWHSQMRAVAS